METPQTGAYFQFLLLFIALIPAIFFMLTQHRTLELVSPSNRRMSPGQVWLQLIPLFGMIWQFFVISKISDSIRNELNTPTGDSIFAEEAVIGSARPTFNAGISYAVLFCIAALPLSLISSFIGLAGLIAWINYWIQLARYKRILKERALVVNR